MKVWYWLFQINILNSYFNQLNHTQSSKIPVNLSFFLTIIRLWLLKKSNIKWIESQ